jgi:hypothetical protein
MSKKKVRLDKTCLNCNHVADQRYCQIADRKTQSAVSLFIISLFIFEDLITTIPFEDNIFFVF